MSIPERDFHHGLLGVTDNYLTETYQLPFGVIASE